MVVVVALVAGAPLVLGTWGLPLLADRLGAMAGAGLLHVLQEASALTAPPTDPRALAEHVADAPDAVEIESPDPPSAVAAASRAGHATTRSPARKRGIRIRAATVLRLANAGARPSAEPVPASGARPAGLALVGVSGLGVGVRDGDILTDAGGAPATSVAAVVNAVVAARRAHAPAMSGRFWRDGEPWLLVVEMPYVE